MFFFSSRRRHTRYIGDWSSDVCSSDLAALHTGGIALVPLQVWHTNVPRDVRLEPIAIPSHWLVWIGRRGNADMRRRAVLGYRSEERRVGKECRVQWEWSTLQL